MGVVTLWQQVNASYESTLDEYQMTNRALGRPFHDRCIYHQVSGSNKVGVQDFLPSDSKSTIIGPCDNDSYDRDTRPLPWAQLSFREACDCDTMTAGH